MSPTRLAARFAAVPVVAPVVALVLAAGPAAAQDLESLPARDPLPLERATEIALARSAAPPAASEAATVLVLEEGRFVVAEEGTSGATCYVSRSVPGSVEPHCFDAEGSRTILPIHLLRAEMGYAGATREEIDAAIEEGLSAGRLELPTRPVVSYMFSAAQILYAPDGKRVGAWKPHVMVYQPGLTSADAGLAGDPAPPVYVFDEGGAEAVLVVIVPEFVEPGLPADVVAAVDAASRAHEAAAR